MSDLENKLDMSLDEIALKRENKENNSSMSPQRGGKRDARVYIGNLAWSVTWQTLKEHMSQAGDVIYADVMQGRDGRSKGCGLVEYRNPADAQTAIETLNNTELNRRKIFVREDREASEPIESNRKNSLNDENNSGKRDARVYIGNLAWSVTWQTLKEHMSQAGDVIYADVMQGRDGRSKGCGLVEYSNPADAQTAIETLNNTELNRRNIFVREDKEPDAGSIASIIRRKGKKPFNASRGRDNYTNRNAPRAKNIRQGDESDEENPSSGGSLYVGNLAFSTTNDGLYDYFSQAVNDVQEAEIITFPSGKSRGFGIVKLGSNAAAQEAIRELNNTELDGRQILVRLDHR